jgi:hypothetical protein
MGVQAHATIPSGATGLLRANEGTYVLRRAPDGGYTYNALTFEARIAPDGHVTFNDMRGSAGATLLGSPLFGAPEPSGGRPSLQRVITDWLRPKPDRASPFSLPEHPELADPLLALPVDMRRPLGPIS